MKISDLLKESQTQQLDELKASDIGRGVGKVAKGVGAVAGGVAGIPSAVKQGFQSGKAAVAGANAQPAQPQTTPASDQNAQDQQATNKKPALGGGIIDKFKKGWNQARGAVAAQDQKPAAEPTAAADVTSKEILQTQKEIQLDLADLKKQVATLNAATLKDRESVMGPTSDSIIRTGNNLSEQLTQQVQKHRNAMYKEQIITGTASLFLR